MRRKPFRTENVALFLLVVVALCSLNFLHELTLLHPRVQGGSPVFFDTFTQKTSLSLYQPKSSDFVQDSVCSGCRHALVSSQFDGAPLTRCGALIRQLVEQSTLTMSQAAMKVAQDYPDDCRTCRSCNLTAQRYWRYDRVLRRGMSGWTIQLPSVPSQHRIPDTALSNLTEFFTRNENTYPNREFLFDYNPSLVVLPPTLIPTFAPRAVYLASFRVSNRHYCLHPILRKAMMHGHKAPARDMLGLALLDSNMTILRDTVLDMSKTGFRNGGAEDYRLFVLASGPVGGQQVYVASNDMIAPIFLEEPNSLSAQSLIIPPAFPANETLLGHRVWRVYIRPFVSCSPCSKPRGLCGKNFNYFQNASGSTVVEVWPSPPHTCRTVNLEEPCQRMQELVDHVVDDSGRLVSPSFATVEEISIPIPLPHQVLLTRGRGGACCIDMEHPVTGESLLVGILHRKTPSQRRHQIATKVNNQSIIDNHYLSQLYAFERTFPYRTVSLSGLFCLGFPEAHEQESLPMAKLTLWRKLWLGQEFDCPRIHFVSGMAVAADDPSSVIIAYGINDCISRMVRVSVEKVQALLFRGPSGL